MHLKWGSIWNGDVLFFESMPIHPAVSERFLANVARAFVENVPENMTSDLWFFAGGRVLNNETPGHRWASSHPADSSTKHLCRFWEVQYWVNLSPTLCPRDIFVDVLATRPREGDAPLLTRRVLKLCSLLDYKSAACCVRIVLWNFSQILSFSQFSCKSEDFSIYVPMLLYNM